MVRERHIVIISDDADKASALKVILAKHHPEVVMKIVENFQQSVISRDRLPGLIILLFTKSANSHIAYLKKLRELKRLKEIPVFVYRGIPDDREREELLREIEKED